jgi:hypothetical protein
MVAGISDIVDGVFQCQIRVVAKTLSDQLPMPDALSVDDDRNSSGCTRSSTQFMIDSINHIPTTVRSPPKSLIVFALLQ